MTNGNDGQKSPDLSGQSRARARERLAIAERSELRVIRATDHELGASLNIERASGGHVGIHLDGPQQRELADWLAEGAEPDPRWTQPEPPEGSLQFVTPSGYSELRLLPRVFQPGPKGSWSMLGLRAGSRVIEFALSDEWQQQLRAWLGVHGSNRATATNRAQAWLDSYCGEMDPATMRFSATELLGAFEAGEDSRDVAQAAEPSNTETAEPAAPAFLREDYEPAPGRPTCASCDHWEGAAQGDPEHGLCRLNPPQSGAFDCSLWPETQGHDYCGQHSDRAMIITGSPCAVEPWEREGRVPPGYADSWDRPPEAVARAGTLTWAVAQVGAVANGTEERGGRARVLWHVPGAFGPMNSDQVISLAMKREACLHQTVTADGHSLRCADCGESSLITMAKGAAR